MRDPSNTRHLAEQAVRILVTNEDEIKHRLLTAYTQRFSYVFPDDVPESVRALVQSVHQRLTKEPTYPGQSRAEAALYRMRRKTAAAIAEDILEIQRVLSITGS